MLKTRMTSKGQVTIPKRLRDRLGLKPGDEINFVENGTEIRVEKLVDASSIDKWVGYLRELDGRGSDEVVEEMRGR